MRSGSFSLFAMPLAATLAAAFLALAGCLPAAAAERFGDIVIDALVVQVEGPAVGDARVYMTIENRSETADRLLGAETEVALQVELRSALQEDGREVETALPAIDIPGNSLVALAPGALHLHLTGLIRPLAEGDRFRLTLEFREAGEAELEVLVVPPGGSDDSAEADSLPSLEAGDAASPLLPRLEPVDTKPVPIPGNHKL